MARAERPHCPFPRARGRHPALPARMGSHPQLRGPRLTFRPWGGRCVSRGAALDTRAKPAVLTGRHTGGARAGGLPPLPLCHVPAQPRPLPPHLPSTLLPPGEPQAWGQAGRSPKPPRLRALQQNGACGHEVGAHSAPCWPGQGPGLFPGCGHWVASMGAPGRGPSLPLSPLLASVLSPQAVARSCSCRPCRGCGPLGSCGR